MTREPALTKTRVEVCVQSLEGVVLDRSWFYDAEENAIPPLTATVAFTGSAENMQVGSSMVCGVSGHLLVESEPLQLDKNSESSSSEYVAKAAWKDERKILGPQAQPHLTIHIPARVLSSSENGDPDTSREPGLIEADTQSTFSEISPSSAKAPANPLQERASKEPYRGTTSIWSDSGATLPEIVELTVRLKNLDHNIPDRVGVAHMVLFGPHEQEGSYTMDLPIRRRTVANLSNGQHQSQIDRCFASNASLRVQINIVHERGSVEVSDSLSTISIPPPPEKIYYTRSYLERQIGPLMEKISEHEKLAKEHKEAQKHAMDVQVPQGDANGPQRSFCEGLWSWKHLVQTMTCAMLRCNGGDGTVDPIVVPDSAASIDSTIATRDSLGI